MWTSIMARIIKRMVNNQELLMSEVIERWGFEFAEKVEKSDIYSEEQRQLQWKRRVR